MEVSALMTVLDNKLEAHLDAHREIEQEHRQAAQKRQSHIALLISLGMLVSPVVSAITIHLLHH